MKLFLSTHFFPDHGGGIEIAALRTANALADRGIQIQWVASDTDQVPPEHNNISYYPLPNNNFIEKAFPFPYPIPSKKSKEIIRELIGNVDAVHLHDYIYSQNIFSAKIALELNKPFIITQHIGAVPYRNPLFNLLLSDLNKYLGVKYLEKAAKTIFISRNVESYFKKLSFDINSTFIPNPVDTNVFHPMPEEMLKYKRKMFGVPDDKAIILFAGRFTEKKGLNTVRAIAEKMPGLFFLLAGRGTINPVSWGLRNVLVAGNFGRNDMPQLYNLADVLLLPSRGEGFPLVIQEALACGKPVITTSENTTAHESLHKYVTGIADPHPGNADEWARVIIDTLYNDNDNKRNAGSGYIRENFSTHSVTERLMKILNEIS